MFDVAILWSTLRIGHYFDWHGIAVHGADAHVPDVMILFSDEKLTCLDEKITRENVEYMTTVFAYVELFSRPNPNIYSVFWLK